MVGAGAAMSGVTLQDYCEEKGLDRALLELAGVREDLRGGEAVLVIPWLSPEGEIVAKQTRFGGERTGPRFMFRRGDRHLLYGLPRLAEARAAGRVVVCEGVTDCFTLWQSGIPAVGLASAGSWRDDRDADHLEGVSELVWIVEPGGGEKATRDAIRRARRVRDRVRVLEMPAAAKDANLFYLIEPVSFLERWRVLVEQAVPWTDWEAEKIAGEARAGLADGEELLDLAELLEATIALLRAYVVLSAEQAVTVALWAVFSHVVEAFEMTPYLEISSPEMRSGKTTLLWMLEALVRDPWPVIQPSDAVLYRKIERDHPTLLLDEADTIFSAKASERYEPLRSLLNAGNWRGVVVPRCIGPTQELRDFEIFCPKATAGIGDYLPRTVADRCIRLALERKRPSDAVKRRRRREIMEAGAPLRGQMAALRRGVVLEQLVRARPDLPEELNDRALESWEPLIAIADLAGGSYPARARTAALELSAGEDDETAGTAHRLVSDMRTVFVESGADRLNTGELVEQLVHLPDSAWAEYRMGKPITGRRIRELLRPYGVRPRHGGSFRGYMRADLEPVWERYLKPPDTNLVSEVSKCPDPALEAGSRPPAEQNRDTSQNPRERLNHPGSGHLDTFPAGNPMQTTPRALFSRLLELLERLSVDGVPPPAAAAIWKRAEALDPDGSDHLEQLAALVRELEQLDDGSDE